jgi:hypothetical protein
MFVGRNFIQGVRLQSGYCLADLIGEAVLKMKRTIVVVLLLLVVVVVVVEVVVVVVVVTEQNPFLKEVYSRLSRQYIPCMCLAVFMY